MFDQLIECEPEGAEFKNRKKYFMVSSIVMGVLFTTAVVYSIYAADIGLGSDSFVISTMLAPVDLPAAKPEIEQPQPVRNTTVSNSPLPSRRENMSSVDEPTIVPKTTSVVANQNLARPISGKYTIGRMDSEPASYGGPGRAVTDGSSGPTSAGLSIDGRTAEVKDVEPPPPVKAPKPPTPSLGVINGKAITLPKPIYPLAAKALNVQGIVNVQVLIDEQGRVLSANATGGHPTLRTAAEQAARGARFSPTLLSHVPVKVSGIIVYNFTRN